MSQQTPTIKAQVRTHLGTKYAKRLRRDGQLPAVVYGHKQDPVHVAIPRLDFVNHLHHGVHLLQLEADGSSETCLIKDVQYDYLGTNVVHVDLARVSLTEEIEVSVPIELKGEDKSPGAKATNAIVEQPIVDLEIWCLAANIPHAIYVDISAMKVDDAITVADLKLPEGVRTDRNPEDVVVSIHLTKEEEEAAPVAPESAQPEVIGEKEKAEAAAKAEAEKK